MVKTKRKLIIIIASISFVLTIGVVFAAFLFSRMVDGDARTGNIYEINKEIRSYSKYTSVEAAKAAIGNPINFDVLSERKSEATVVTNKINNEDINAETITCLASKRTTNFYDEADLALPYLNQIGLYVSFTTTIDSYARISFEDVWISKKRYQGSDPKETIIVKDQLNGVYEQVDNSKITANNVGAYFLLTESEAQTYNENTYYYTKEIINEKWYYRYAMINNQTELSGGTYYTLTETKQNKYDSVADSDKRFYKFSAESPFEKINQDENSKWYYDARTNVAYYKEMIDIDESQKGKKTINFGIDIANDYFYQTKEASYDEIVKVQLSYHVEVVQANRCMAIWHIQPEELF